MQMESAASKKTIQKANGFKEQRFIIVLLKNRLYSSTGIAQEKLGLLKKKEVHFVGEKQRFFLKNTKSAIRTQGDEEKLTIVLKLVKCYFSLNICAKQTDFSLAKAK